MWRQEVYLTTFDLFFTYGFWAIMKFVWGVPAILGYLTIKGLKSLN